MFVRPSRDSDLIAVNIVDTICDCIYRNTVGRIPNLYGCDLLIAQLFITEIVWSKKCPLKILFGVRIDGSLGKAALVVQLLVSSHPGGPAFLILAVWS